MISKQIIFIIEIVLQISRPVAQYYSLFIYRYFYRYLLFSESCLLLFIVPSSCIGCKSSLMVLAVFLKVQDLYNSDNCSIL